MPLFTPLYAAQAQEAVPEQVAPKQNMASPINQPLQPAVEKDRTVYQPQDFARFSPKTALDMVTQIPGFTILSSDSGLRGLGDAKENVLINGQRIAGKSNDAITTLGRMAASSVLRIEIVDGAKLDIPGLNGQVANVIIKPDGFKAQFKWEPDFRPRLENNWLRGEISASGEVQGGGFKGTGFTIAFKNDALRQGHWGPDIGRDGDGNYLFRRDEFATYDTDAPQVSGSVTRKAANGAVFNANLGYGLYRFKQVTDGIKTESGVPNIAEHFTDREREWNFEGGADYEFPFAGGKLKLIGLQRLEHSPFLTTFDTEAVDGSIGPTGERYHFIADESESVLRGEYSWKSSNQNEWRISLEGAYNSLDTESQLAELQSDGSYADIPLPGGTAKVDEKRVEAILSYGRPLSPTLTLQSSMGAEYSQISQSGPHGLTRQFIRPKGRINLSWKAQPTLTLNLTLQRKVEQLSFYDFIASVDLVNNNGSAANPDLVPPQTWHGELEAIKQLGKYGTITMAVAGAHYSDIVDRIPISDTEEAIGNLPSATRFRFSGKATLLGEPVGLAGVKLDLAWTLRHARVRDPLTGEKRPISGDEIRQLSADIRHDIKGTNWAWGGGVFEGKQYPVYRLDAIFRDYKEQPLYAELYVENKDIFGLTVRGTVKNLAKQIDSFERTFYVDRRDGPVAIVRDRDRKFGTYFGLSVSGSL